MMCPACQAENPAQNKFCGECGARLRLTCPACGHPNEPTQKFCGECGTRLRPATPPAPAPTAAQPVPAPAQPVKEAAPPPRRPASGGRKPRVPGRRPRHLHAEAPRREDPHLEGRPRGRTQAGHRDVLGRSGFTAMSERLDPEEVHAIMDRVLRGDPRRRPPLRGHHQPVPRRRRDGALRRAHRARGPCRPRAARGAGDPGAARAAARRTSQRTHGVDFRVRIGINTGLVVVGAIGRDLRMDYTAVGDTTNLAARLLNIAQPGQIVAEPAHPATSGRGSSSSTISASSRSRGRPSRSAPTP